MAATLQHTESIGEARAASPAPRLLLCAASAALAACLMLPSVASAEVRRADVIKGETVEARGLTVAQCPSIDALYACVMDEDGTVYFERDATSPTQIASVTKIMTGVVALDAVDQGLVPLTDHVIVSAAAAEVGESSAGLQEGDMLTLQDALYALLVPSGNDAAVTIAEYVGQALIDANGGGGDAVTAFCDAMNAKAAELGCVDTVYRNPHGLDDGEWTGDQHSCAADQAKVVQCAMLNELFRTIVAGGDATISVDRAGEDIDIALESTDGFLDIYEYACGVKTGFTDLAGPSFAGAANNGERYLYAIVIHSSSEAQRFVDAQTLCEWAYDNIIDYQLVNSTETVQSPLGEGDTPVFAHVAHGDWIDQTFPATLSDTDAAVEVFALDGNVSQSVEFEEVHGTVSAGQKVGTVTFKQRNETIAEYDLVACEDAAAPDFLQSIGIWWDRLFRGFAGQPQTAESVVVNTMPLINDKTAVETTVS